MNNDEAFCGKKTIESLVTYFWPKKMNDNFPRISFFVAEDVSFASYIQSIATQLYSMVHNIALILQTLNAI